MITLILSQNITNFNYLGSFQGTLFGRHAHTTTSCLKINKPNSELPGLYKQLRDYDSIQSWRGSQALVQLQSDSMKLVIYYSGAKDCLFKLAVYPLSMNTVQAYEDYNLLIKGYYEILNLIRDFDQLSTPYKEANIDLFISAIKQYYMSIPPEKRSDYKEFEKAAEIKNIVPSIVNLFKEASKITKEQANTRPNRE